MTRALHPTGFAALALLSLTAACAPFMAAPASNPAPAQPAPQVQPPAPPATPKDRLVAAIEANGCLLTPDNVGGILLRANLTRDELAALTQELRAEGRVEVPPAGGGTIRLLSQNCI